MSTLHPMERELAARAALLVARMYEMHGWTWAGTEGDHVPMVESIAQTIEELIEASRDEPAQTGRLMVWRNHGLLDVYLNVGTLSYDDERPDTVMVDEGIRPYLLRTEAGQVPHSEATE